MFELFKRAKSEVMVAAGLQKTEAEIIEEIHAAVDGAEDALLREAELILAQPIAKADTHIIQKAERLEKLGFTKTPEVQKASGARAKIAEEQRKKEMNLELAELIRYHKQTYPFQKFLTIDELDRICDKYGLIHAPVGAFKGTVPDKNLAEIERAPERKYCDQTKNRFFFKITVFYRDATNEFKKFFEKEIETSIFIDTDSVLKEYLRGKVSDASLQATWLFRQGEARVADYSGLFICAPKSQFDLTGVEQQEKGYNQMHRVELRDPVVYRYVRGGVQVLSKWGLEASDPALLNEIDN